MDQSMDRQEVVSMGRGKTERVAAMIARGPGASPIAPAALSPADAPPGDAPRDIETITAEILDLKLQAGRAIMGIGQRLIEAKAALPYGEWMGWLAEKVEFSPRTAENLMRIAREWSDPQLAADLGARKILTLLALPPDERTAFLAETVDGKRVRDLTARELEQAVRERNEARARADAAESRLTEALSANERIGTENDVLRGRVRELEARPVDVAVEPIRDEDAIREAAEQAARDAEKRVRDAMERRVREASDASEKAGRDLDAVRARLRDATAAKEAAEARVTALEAVQSGAAQAVQEAEARARNAERERDAARRAGASEDRVLYMILAKRIQADADELSAIRDRARRSGDADLVLAVGRALSALGDKLSARAAQVDAGTPDGDGTVRDAADTGTAGDPGDGDRSGDAGGPGDGEEARDDG